MLFCVDTNGYNNFKGGQEAKNHIFYFIQINVIHSNLVHQMLLILEMLSCCLTF